MKRVDVPDDVITDHDAGDQFRLPSDTAHYIGNVLRRSSGDRLELFDGTGDAVIVRIVSADDEVTVELENRLPEDRNESPVTITLYQAIPKGKRWKWLLQKATELGVDSIVPLETRHTVVKIPDDRLAGRLERWEKIIASAARQSQRAQTPTITAPETIDNALERGANRAQFVAHTGDGLSEFSTILSDALLDNPVTIGVWIGPEGGFHDDEIDTLVDAGVQPTAMGPRVLRSETAGMVSVALIQAACGDL